MTVFRMDHVGVVVEDLDAAIAFFRELGLELEGRTSVAGEWVDRLAGLHDVRAGIAMMRTPDGYGRLELTTYQHPKAIGSETANAIVNTLGLRNVMFAVDDIEEMVARLRTHGAELVGELVEYEDHYRLGYLRGPAGVIVALAQPLKPERRS